MARNDIADVLIIGSGASGGPFAWSLSQVKGLKIVCLEQGDWDRPRKDETDWTRDETWGDGTWKSLIKAPRQPGANYFENGYPFDHTESDWEPILGNHVGGATVHYAAGWSRLLPSDFLLRTLTGVGEDWPIRYEDLAAWYDFNDNFVGISGVPGNPAYPNRHVDFLPAPAQSGRKSAFLAAADKLGWRYFLGNERAVITVSFKGRNPRTREAKNRADIVHWPEAIQNGVVLKTRATVREITVSRESRAAGAVYYDANGQLHEEKARLVVVACNGIGTPRLLLNSKSSRFPRGLANGSGLVGKGLMGHPMNSVVAALVNDNSSQAFGGGGGSIDEFLAPAYRGGGVGGFTLVGGGFTGPVAAALGLPPASLVTVIPAALRQGPRATGEELPWGLAHHAAFQQRFRRTATIMVSTSELANDANRIELDPILTDDFGTPAPKLVYKRDENTHKLMAFAIERAKQLLEAMGATDLVSADVARDFVGRGSQPGHYLGTARMGLDPARSVVDKWGRAHDVENLFIIDGSVFTTSGVSTPTSTIQAIALRTADYVKKNVKELLKG